MPLTLDPIPVPLRVDAGGLIRVGQTRVTLDAVIGAYLDGASAESIHEQYDVLRLEDVYAAISYYLRHRGEVDEYMAARDRERQEARAASGQAGLRERLLARRAAGGQA